MILGSTNILNSSATLTNDIPAPDGEFDFLRICGSVEIDEVNGLNVELTEEQIYTDLLTVQVFGTNTMFLGHLDDTFQFGNFNSQGLPITHWNILRRVSGGTTFTLLQQVPNTADTIYLDIRAQSGQTYEYAIQSVSNGTAGNLLISEEVSMSFHGWSLTSLDFDPDTNTGTQFIFDVDVRTSGITTAQGRTQFDNFSQYPKISYGVQEFDSSSITVFPLFCNGNSIREPDRANNELLKTFITDRNAKILKNGSGRQWLVDTSGFDTNYRDILTNNNTTNTNEQPYDISFSWVEIGEVTS